MGLVLGIKCFFFLLTLFLIIILIFCLAFWIFRIVGGKKLGVVRRAGGGNRRSGNIFRRAAAQERKQDIEMGAVTSDGSDTLVDSDTEVKVAQLAKNVTINKTRMTLHSFKSS